MSHRNLGQKTGVGVNNCQGKCNPSSDIKFKITMLMSCFLRLQWCIHQGWKLVYFWSCINIQKMFHWASKGYNFWKLGSLGHVLSSPNRFRGKAPWSFCYWDFFQSQNTYFIMPIQSSFTVFFQYFLYTASMHAKVCHFFLSEWHRICRISRIHGRFSPVVYTYEGAYNN